MTDFEKAIQDAVANKDIPGCALVATNRDGTYKYTKAFGNTSMKEGCAKILQLDTVMWVASCTKLLTSISAMQLVERGKLNLDDPVYKLIPELESVMVLEGFEENGKPIERKQTNPITLRLLLTHSSGMTYEATHPKAMAWLKYHNRLPVTGSTVLDRFDYPLMFQPGESWMYGPSIDFAGLLVERASGQKLEEYMKQNIWGPLGMKDTTFFLSTRPDLKERMADMSYRGGDGKVGPMESFLPYQDEKGNELKDAFGGQGIFTTAEDYLKVLQALLNSDQDEKVLKKATLEEFFKPQLGKGSFETLNAILESDDMARNAMGGTDKEIKKDWGLGGVLLQGDGSDGKKSGTMLWGGYPNLIWWLDRKTGITGLYAGQVLPTGDAKVAALNRSFEAGMYKQYASQKQSA